MSRRSDARIEVRLVEARKQRCLSVRTREKLAYSFDYGAAQNGLSSARSISFQFATCSCFPNVANAPYPQFLFKDKDSDRPVTVRSMGCQLRLGRTIGDPPVARDPSP